MQEAQHKQLTQMGHEAPSIMDGLASLRLLPPGVCQRENGTCNINLP